MAKEQKLPIHFLMNFLMFFLHITKIYCIILLFEIATTLLNVFFCLYGLVTFCEIVDTTPFVSFVKLNQITPTLNKPNSTEQKLYQI